MSFCNPYTPSYSYSDCYTQNPCYDPCGAKTSYWGSRRCQTICDSPILFNTHYSTPCYSYNYSPFGTTSYYRHTLRAPVLNAVDLMATAMIGIVCLGLYGSMLFSDF